MFTLYFLMIRDVVSDNPWTYGSTTMPLLLTFSTVFLIFDTVYCEYPLVRASWMCSLSFCLFSSSVTSVSHLSSNVRITPIFWCNGWCEDKFRYCMGIGLCGYSFG